MEFVVLLCVLAITLTQVIALPIDTKDPTTKDANINKEDVKGLKLKMPTILKHETRITINGTLNLSDENFTVVFPSKEGDDSPSCTINFNYKSNLKIEASSEVQRTRNYNIKFKGNPEPEFILRVEAILTDDSKELEISINGDKSGPSPPIYCMIKSFEEIGQIHFKTGVKLIKSILFVLDDTNDINQK